MSDDVYMRRVRDPNPMLEQLAGQVLEEYERHVRPSRDARVNFALLSHIAYAYACPIDYVLDERERRVREQ